jgi:RimJ/RimL family protein N-acetyltransferase
VKLIFPILEGERIRLREFAERDLVEFARYRADPEVACYQSWDAYTLEDAKRLYAAQIAARFGTLGSWHQLAIADKGSDALLGDCALHFRDEEELEIGFTLAPARQGQGLAREAVGLLLGHMPQPRILAVTDAENLAAQKLLVDLGFREEQKRAVVFKGRPGSERLFAIDRSIG